MTNVTNSSARLERALVHGLVVAAAQQLMFEQLRNGSPMLNEAPVEPPPEPEMLPPSSPPPSHWYILKASRPSNTEVLLLATMLSLHLSKEDLEDWVSRVNEDEENIAALGDVWAPPKDYKG